MKQKKIELDVDFIGIQGEKLTKDKESAISQYLKINAKATPIKTKRRIKSDALTA